MILPIFLILSAQIGSTKIYAKISKKAPTVQETISTRSIVISNKVIIQENNKRYILASYKDALLRFEVSQDIKIPKDRITIHYIPIFENGHQRLIVIAIK